MKGAPHLIRLYYKTSRRYKKLVARLNRESASAYQRKSFLLEIRKLVRKLRELQLQLRIAAATGTVVLMLNVNNVQAQTNPIGPFVLQNRTNNPLREPIFTYEPIMTVIDFDNDNDEDVVIGEYNYNGAHFRYFENKSSEGKPVYLELEGADNPLDSIFAETYRGAPAFADIDQDGDQDLFIGQNGGWIQYPYPYISTRGIEYYRNDGGTFTKQTGIWDPVAKEGNPFDTLKFGYTVSPVLIDFDHDGDVDMISASEMTTGTYPYYSTKYLHYFVNDGVGNFTPAASDLTLDTQPSYYGGDTLYPALADLDGDGDYDLVFGNYYDGYLRYYVQETPGNFIEQTAAWDPVAKTGNPFNGFNLGLDASPAFIDFDKDGQPDLLVADQSGYYNNKYSDNIVNYYHNSGDGVFVEKDEFDNPFDGIFVKQDAAPTLVDIDDDGDLDALIGNKYYYSYYDYSKLKYVTVNSYLTHYQNANGLLKKITGDENPVDTLQVYGKFVPQFADVDGDNDRDLISGDYNGQVTLFRNEGGVYKQDTTSANPFKGLSFPYDGAAKLVDIDNDADLDLFMSNYGDIHFFINTGSPQAPAYSELLDAENPLDSARSWIWGTSYLNFSDLDHDGDRDMMFNGSSPYNVEQQTLLYWENTGTAENPKYDTINVEIFQDMDGNAVRLELADYDGDGDLDAFAGLDDGTVRYLENQNETVNTAVTGVVAQYNKGETAVVIEPALTLTDPDNDFIVQATVSIQDFQAGETLDFTPLAGVTGTFDTNTGVLTFRGKATLAGYEALLRTVTFEVIDAGGRKGTPKKSIVDKTIAFAVFDTDFTNPQVSAKSLQIFINDPPAINPQTINFTAGGSETVDLKLLISDPNGAGDLDLSSLKVTQAPGSGATTSIDSNGLLTVDYNTLSFLGTETMMVEVCDLKGDCAQNTLTLIVTNTPPVIAPEPVTTPAGSSKSINLITITTDADDNLDAASYTIVQAPSSGATASIQQVSSTEVNLLLDYQGITFHGNDQLTIGVCDKAGACTESVLIVQVDVDSQVIVYNAIAPNSPGDNRFMRITGLPENNKVSIFSRWGDKVFDTENYQNSPSGNSFKGLNNNGNALASGTYFYLIEIPGQKDITGYLTLKQ